MRYIMNEPLPPASGFERDLYETCYYAEGTLEPRVKWTVGDVGSVFNISLTLPDGMRFETDRTVVSADDGMVFKQVDGDHRVVVFFSRFVAYSDTLKKWWDCSNVFKLDME